MPFVFALIAAPNAAADVWGYVDEQGRPHVATEKLDDRYQLFFRGRSSADLPVAPAPSDTDESFKQTAIYQRIVNHPNAKRFEPMIVRYAKQESVDVALVKAVVAVESAFEPEVVSPKGAIGLMQVIPETGERYGIAGDARRSTAERLYDPATNLRIGTRYLRDLLDRFEYDLALALAAYNAGEGSVLTRYNTVPPFAETQTFVRLVQQVYALYRPVPPPQRAAVTLPGLTRGTTAAKRSAVAH